MGDNTLSSWVFPKNVTSMGEDTFEGCTGLTSISWNDAVYGNVNDFFEAWKIENPNGIIPSHRIN